MTKKIMRSGSRNPAERTVILPVMDLKYYAHFVLTEIGGNGFGEFTGVVHIDRVNSAGLFAEDARHLLADNLDVDADDVHVIHWSQLH